MSCIRLARGFTGRDKIIKFEGCYQGTSTRCWSTREAARSLMPPDSAGVPAEVRRADISVPFNDIAAVRAVFQENSKAIAAIILEPIPQRRCIFRARISSSSCVTNTRHARSLFSTRS